jgi:Flp pilus assembly protein TadB
VNQNPDLPVTITSARPSRSSDIHRRQTRYLLSMAVRTICFVLAIVTSGPLRWVLVAGAVLLPYVAVVLANASDRRSTPGPSSFAVEDRPLLESAPEATGRGDRQ